MMPQHDLQRDCMASHLAPEDGESLSIAPADLDGARGCSHHRNAGDEVDLFLHRQYRTTPLYQADHQDSVVRVHHSRILRTTSLPSQPPAHPSAPLNSGALSEHAEPLHCERSSRSLQKASGSASSSTERQVLGHPMATENADAPHSFKATVASPHTTVQQSAADCFLHATEAPNDDSFVTISDIAVCWTQSSSSHPRPHPPHPHPYLSSASPPAPASSAASSAAFASSPASVSASHPHSLLFPVSGSPLQTESPSFHPFSPPSLQAPASVSASASASPPPTSPHQFSKPNSLAPHFLPCDSFSPSQSSLHCHPQPSSALSPSYHLHASRSGRSHANESEAQQDSDSIMQLVQPGGAPAVRRHSADENDGDEYDEDDDERLWTREGQVAGEWSSASSRSAAASPSTSTHKFAEFLRSLEGLGIVRLLSPLQLRHLRAGGGLGPAGTEGPATPPTERHGTGSAPSAGEDAEQVPAAAIVAGWEVLDVQAWHEATLAKPKREAGGKKRPPPPASPPDKANAPEAGAKRSASNGGPKHAFAMRLRRMGFRPWNRAPKPATSGYDFDLRNPDADRHGFEFVPEMLDRYLPVKVAKSHARDA